MKRLLTLAVLSLTLWVGTSADAWAGAFGLKYNSRYCDNCCFCIRPYNAFSSLACGVVNAAPPCQCFPSCHYCPGPKLGYLDCHDTRGLLWKPGLLTNHTPSTFSDGWVDDGSPGAFPAPKPFAFCGTPVCRSNGSMPWPNGGCGGGPIPAPGHEPPPGPPVSPAMPNHAKSIIWLPPVWYPGMYGYPNPMVNYQAYYGMPRMPQYPARAPIAPASYQQPYPNYGAYQPTAWWYPAAGASPYQGWYNTGYYPQNGQ